MSKPITADYHQYNFRINANREPELVAWMDEVKNKAEPSLSYYIRVALKMYCSGGNLAGLHVGPMKTPVIDLPCHPGTTPGPDGSQSDHMETLPEIVIDSGAVDQLFRKGAEGNSSPGGSGGQSGEAGGAGGVDEKELLNKLDNMW